MSGFDSDALISREENKLKNAVFNITEYEKFVTDNDWTAAFDKAVNDIAENNGGTLFVPAGTYMTRSIELKSNMTLYLDNGSELSFSDEIEKYDILEGNFEGITRPMFKPCIYVKDAVNVVVKGEGTINGNGRKWWERILDRTLEEARPCLVYFENCENIKLFSVTLTNSPVWTVHPLFCNNVVVSGVTIKNPSDSPNTDGINPDSCTNVRISDCLIDVGDDCIAIKSGVEDSLVKKECENITITNCVMVHGHGGIVIGSEASGGVKNLVVSNCVFQDTDRGIRLKTRRRRGGSMEKLTFSNIIMDRVMCPFVFNMCYFGGKVGKEPWVSDINPAPVDEGTPVIRDMNINNITVINATSCAGVISGLAEQPVENITFSNCSITMTDIKEPEPAAMMTLLKPTSGAGFFIRNAKGLVFENVKLYSVIGAEFDVDDSVQMEQKFM